MSVMLSAPGAILGANTC